MPDTNSLALAFAEVIDEAKANNPGLTPEQWDRILKLIEMLLPIIMSFFTPKA